MNRRISISVILSIVILIASVFVSVKLKSPTKETSISANTTTMTENSIDANEEMRGLWVSYLSLDMQNTDKSFESFKEKFNNIITEANKYKCNTLIVQVRPFCDALYNSSYFPYSHILSGEQGKKVGYDPLKYMCKTSHENNMKIHAWINPLRVSNTSSDFELSDDNPYIKNPEISLVTTSGVYLNPALIDARNLITNGVREIVENYEIDGIQFDDYFYPPDISKEDAEYYNNYKDTTESDRLLTLSDWRENNINLLIAEVYKTIKSADQNVVFGISPQGNIENNKSIYANPALWCKVQGYIDYICPQLYFSTSHPTLPFEKALKNWKELPYHKTLKVYIGLAVYKAGTKEDNGTWQLSSSILKDELLLLRKYKYDGFMLYEYRSLKEESAQKELSNLSDAI